MDEKPCIGLEHVLSRYKEVVPHVNLAGPTSFAPIIYKAMSIVKATQGARPHPKNLLNYFGYAAFIDPVKISLSALVLMYQRGRVRLKNMLPLPLTFSRQ